MNKEIYKDPKKTVAERVDDLISRMTPLEKVCQLSCAYAYGGTINTEEELKNGIGQIGMSSGCMSIRENIELVNRVQKYLIENTRLGIPALFHVETLNGVSLSGATTYPIPLGLAANWDKDIIKELAGEISEEAAACGQKIALAPVLDVARDPRWGRMGETYGESPALVSELGNAYVHGIQDKNKVAACAKHFLGYAASEGGLNMSGAHIGPRELREVYAKPFKTAIEEAGLKAVMNCYLAIDGEPVTGSKKYLTDLLRGELNFNGLTIADYGSMDKLCDVFHVAPDRSTAGQIALEAGLDTETPRKSCLNDEFISRSEQGIIPMETVDVPLRRLLKLKFELGLFDNPYADEKTAQSILQANGHLYTSYKAACGSMTLLKNQGGILPLKNIKSIAVIGPNGDDVRALFGGYTYPAFYEGMRDMLLGIAESMGLEGVEAAEGQKQFLLQTVAKLPEVGTLIKSVYSGVDTVYNAICKEAGSEVAVNFAQGCNLTGGDKSKFSEAIDVAKASEVIIFVCGGRNGSGNGCTMGENVDSCNVGLPEVQEELAKELYKTGKPLVIVHMDGKPLSSVWAKENAAAILEAWHPGQLGARAIAETLFGKNNPSGKLPVTAVRHAGQIPVYAEQPNGSGALNRGQTNNKITQGYADESGLPLWSFGYGLNYSEFKINNEKISQKEIKTDGVVQVMCDVTNIGEKDGAEVVQLYFRDLCASVVRPDKQLADFARVELKGGETKQIELVFKAEQSAYYDNSLTLCLDRGEIELLIGNSSDNLKSLGIIKII
ncbi:MAG: glycoside hydrolase family 3 N-terminal domain-containing protein [Candidatus Coproplasma sp.]